MHAKIFKSGNSQAVRLSKDFRFEGSEVEIYREGDKVILMPIKQSLQSTIDCLTQMPDNFMSDGREQEFPQERESF